MVIKPMIPVAPDLSSNDEEDEDGGGNFIDDDFGLGGIDIDQESEQLKKQQQAIEEEVSNRGKYSTEYI